jgi:hypothetical protein
MQHVDGLVEVVHGLDDLDALPGAEADVPSLDVQRSVLSICLFIHPSIHQSIHQSIH